MRHESKVFVLAFIARRRSKMNLSAQVICNQTSDPRLGYVCQLLRGLEFISRMFGYYSPNPDELGRSCEWSML